MGDRTAGHGEGAGAMRRGWSRRRTAAAIAALAVLGAGVAVGVKVAADWFHARSAAEDERRWAAIIEGVQQQRWPRVEAMLRDWIDDHDDDGRARLMLGELLRSSGRAAEAAEVLEGVGPDDPAWADVRLVAADAALRAGDANRAERLLREIADRRPEAVEPRLRLVDLLAEQLRTAESRELLWQVYGMTKEPRYLLGLAIESLRPEVDVRRLGPAIDRYYEQSPGDPFLARVHGLRLLWEGRPAEALADLEAAAEALEDDPVGRFALAECRMQLGRPVADPTILGECPKPPADAARWWVFRGRLESAAGRHDDALASFKKAVALDPESEEAHHRLGRSLALAGDPEGAADHEATAGAIHDRRDALRRAFEQVLRKGLPRDAAVLEQLGDRSAESGLVAVARAWYGLAIDLDPGRDPARAALARLDGRDDAPPVALSRPRRVARPSAPVGSDLATASADEGPTPRLVDVAAEAGVRYRYNYGPRPDLYLADTMGGGVAMIDADGDGWLDLYFVNGCSMPYDPDDPPAPNRLYRNRGDGTFEDVTASAGVGGVGYGMGAAVADYDGDGDGDLYVTGFGSTVLYRNRGDGTFEDVTESAGVGSDLWTTAAGFGDLDGDGDLDLYVATYVEDDPAVHRDCHDDAGRPNHCSPGHYPSQQDLLFRNEGDGTFAEVGAEAGIHAPAGRGLGLAIADLDGDDRLDLYVANDASPDYLFHNLGGLRFRDDGSPSGLAVDGSGHATASMGVVADDLDGDGRIDLFHTNFLNEPNTLHRNLGGGLYLDATMSAGLAAPSLATTGFGAVAFDLENDGRLDLFLANGHVDDQPHAGTPMAEPPQLFRNRGGGRFVLAGTAGSPYLARRVVGRGAAAGDLDNDGRVDLVVVHRDGPVSILRNTTAGGHRLGVRLRGASGGTPVGARLTVVAGGRRLVRWLTSGTGYLSVGDPRLWFGLGDAAAVDRLEVRWPSGVEESWPGPAADRIVELCESEPPEILSVLDEPAR